MNWIIANNRRFGMQWNKCKGRKIMRRNHVSLENGMTKDMGTDQELIPEDVFGYSGTKKGAK